MFALDPLCRSVQDNCDIADAKSAGGFTMCTYLMRMREYFRWEQGLGFDCALPLSEIGNWIHARENHWEQLTDKPYAPLTIDGATHDPFDAAAINAQLLPHGYVYSAGIGLRGGAHFFLGKLEADDGGGVYQAGEEYARDLSGPVAMTRGPTIFVRRDALRRMLWERVQEWRWDRRDNALGAALACYAFDEDLTGALRAITEHEIPNLIRHELGERLCGSTLGASWGERIAQCSRKHELALRAVRDHWADCAVLLPTLLENADRASLLFYRAQLIGLRGILFPELRSALDDWAGSGDCTAARRAVGLGNVHWQDWCLRLRDADAADWDRLLEEAVL